MITRRMRQFGTHAGMAHSYGPHVVNAGKSGSMPAIFNCRSFKMKGLAGSFLQLSTTKAYPFC